MRPFFAFESRGEQGFGAYHDTYAGGSTVSRWGDEFGASVTAYQLPRLLVFERQVIGAAHHRDAGRVRRDGFDHFTLQMLRRGSMRAGPLGEERAMQPGDLAIFDTSRPQRTMVERAEYVVLSLPRDVVEAALPHARHLHGSIVPRGVGGLLGDFVLSLVRNASTLSGTVAGQAGGMVASLLAGSVGDLPARPAFEGVDGPSLHRFRAETFIDAHLGDPSLDVERTAAALGLSRSALYRAFAPEGGVARHILSRRVRRLAAALRRADDRRNITALASACGFSSEAHCSRAFKAVHGVAPGQFRAAVRSGGEVRRAPGRVGDLATMVREAF